MTHAASPPTSPAHPHTPAANPTQRQAPPPPPADGGKRRPLPTALLLHGPPGTGKTLLAKAAASALRGRFINVSLPGLLRSGVGESERLLWHLFDAAAAAAPCIVMFDEMQALFTARHAGGGGDGAARMSAVLTSMLLACLDRLAARPPSAPPVLLLGATNAPHALDADVVARFGRVCEVAPPRGEDVAAIVRQWLQRWAASGLLVPAAPAPAPLEAAVAAAAAAIVAAHPSVSAAGVVAALQRAVADVLAQESSSRPEGEAGEENAVLAAVAAAGWRLA
jgi:SpoVK/Ycf46/Vps4 family AAA+-type ATPase